jgi:hypothetical protein
MRRTWKGFRLVAAIGLGLSGCVTQDKPPKPLPLPEECIMPPAEARFSQAPTFPEKTLNQGLQAKQKNKDDDGPPAAFRGPGGSRMGAGGGY